MLVAQKGKCVVLGVANWQELDIKYKEKAVFIDTRKGLKIGNYIPAYFVENGMAFPFGEIKFTVGTLQNHIYNCKYVLCEY